MRKNAENRPPEDDSDIREHIRITFFFYFLPHFVCTLIIFYIANPNLNWPDKRLNGSLDSQLITFSIQWDVYVSNSKGRCIESMSCRTIVYSDNNKNNENNAKMAFWMKLTPDSISALSPDVSMLIVWSWYYHRLVVMFWLKLN